MSKSKARNLCNPEVVAATISDRVESRAHLLTEPGSSFARVPTCKRYHQYKYWFDTVFRKGILRETNNFVNLVSDPVHALMVECHAHMADESSYDSWARSAVVEPRPVVSLSFAEKKGWIYTVKDWMLEDFEKHKIVHVFSGFEELKNLVDHYIDWIVDAKIKPETLKNISFLDSVKKIGEWELELEKRAEREEAEREEEIDLKTSNKVWESKSKRYKVVELMTREAYRREGRLMKHCVASYYGLQNSRIFSFRKNVDNKPIVTIETTSDLKLVNALMACNEIPKGKIKIILEVFYKAFGVDTVPATVKDEQTRIIGHHQNVLRIHGSANPCGEVILGDQGGIVSFRE